MKLLTTAVLSWLAGIAAHLLPTYVIIKEPVNLDDVIGIGLMSLIASLPIFFLIYTPGLLWLRKRLQGCRPKIYFPLLAATLLNLPVFASVGLLYKFAGAFAPQEALLFLGQFLVAGFVFGAGFVWHAQSRPLQKTTSAIAT